MLGSFWDSVAGKLADRWAGIAAPALVFWAGGVLTRAFAGGGWSGLAHINEWLNGRTVLAQIAAVLAALVVVAASAVVVQRLTTPALRLLEGYWPGWLAWWTERRLRHVLRRKSEDDAGWQRLQRVTELAEPTREQLSALAHLENHRRHRPVLDSELRPTRIGNVLRAAETRPFHRYGLEAVVVWPRLWLVLPDLARQELTGARASLDASVAAAIWGVGFVAFTPLAWWAAPAGIAVAAAAVLWWVPARAEVFADLVEAAYDLYRSDLYQHLRWPLPETPADEQQTGQEVSKYLVRGSDKPDPKFTAPL